MKRSEFLASSSLIAAGIGAGLLSCRKKNSKPLVFIPEHERIKTGIIGLGERGKTILKVLQQVPEIELVAACDILDIRFEEAKHAGLSNAKTYRDYRKLLQHPNLDAVIISTPLYEHFPMAMDALDANLHILCEKVLCYNIEQARALREKVKQSSKLFQVSYQYQMNPVFNSIKEIIQKGYCGKITHIESVWHRNSNWRRPVPSPDLERLINWRLYADLSGGLMAELVGHQLNMVGNLLEAHPLSVVGAGGIDYWKDGRETYDNVHAIYTYPNGVKAHFSSILANGHEGFKMKFYGDKACIESSWMEEANIYPEQEADENWTKEVDAVTGASIRIIGKTQRRSIKPKINSSVNYPFDGNYENTTWLLYKNFAAAIKGTEDLKIGFDDGYQSAIAVHMGNEAMQQHGEVRWSERFDS